MKPIVQPQSQPAPFRSATAGAGLLRAALWLSVLTAASRAAVLIASSRVLNRPDLASRQVVTDLLGAVTVFNIATLVAAGVTWLLWVAWTSRLERNAVALGVGEGSVGARGAILWWLVPGFNLLVPFGQLLGVDRRLTDGEQRSRDALLATWWLALLIGAAAVIATTVPLPTTDAPDASDAGLFLRAGLASLAWLAALLLSLRVVRQVQRDEDRRSAVVRQGWRPGAPSWPVALLGSAPSGFPTGYPSRVPARARSAIPTGTRPAARSGSTAGRRRVSSGAPGAIVLLLLVGGLAGLIYGAIKSSNGSHSPNAFPAAQPSLAVIVPTALPAPAPTASPARPSASIAASPFPTIAASASPTIAASGSPSAAAASPTALASARPSAAANPVLMQHVGLGDGSCTAVDPADRPPGSIAAIECRPGNAVVATLRYALYPNPEAAEQAYAADLAATGVTPGTGSCFHAIAGEGSFTTNYTARGRVFCHLDAAGVPSMVWFDRTLAIVGRATGTGLGLKPLCDWWASESGPA